MQQESSKISGKSFNGTGVDWHVCLTCQTVKYKQFYNATSSIKINTYQLFTF